MDNFESLVSLNLIPQIGSARLDELLGYFGQPQDIFNAGRDILGKLVGGRIGEGIVSFDTGKLDRDLDAARKAGVEVITLLDRGYPRNLRQIPGRPIVLYISGRIADDDVLSLGVVGSRRATLYGLSSAEKFSGEMASSGLTIVSGMARGVDTYAHRGALKAGGRTIAVMGSGFNHIYPPENRGLAEKIAKNGAVVSEFPMDTRPLAQNFPRRNRLISGLSLGVLVTEAARNSGALITADFALEQGRDVFALPGRIDACASAGTNQLLKQGAKLVTCSEDILGELNFCGYLKNAAHEPEKKERVLCAEEEKLYRCIGCDPASVDELIEKTSFPNSRISSLILGLQFRKLIKALPGKQFIRS
ncbi:MAG: DNA-processing protein DprA [Candidatus Omnitrophica bacterium]|nr:DNA-processing protein DprA [Candidatus Omnitrophota bacterium]MDD5771418.1 DNA-processing protein DprA [Candidatus Omnitrophota bacterium]